ncbi:Uncharacterised protein [Legionella beliardensis]|uniref:Lipoprotein n=1 Tax=Legionella beliardensis TaxID=91822 RepID=A0A378I1C4_9GAMM|nr:hypothetical protein [Legionella beliardensis]STX28406.1 Uncharacterised protein [Legionella beliardensis]
MNKTILGFAVLMSSSVACFAAASTDNTNTPNTTSSTSTTNGTGTGNTTQTSMKANWMCTTNASSSDVAADKSADDKMANQKMSAKEAFEFASKHCRDCTKITCEVND